MGDFHERFAIGKDPRGLAKVAQASQSALCGFILYVFDFSGQLTPQNDRFCRFSNKCRRHLKLAAVRTKPESLPVRD
jgi:hypothetical protein